MVPSNWYKIWELLAPDEIKFCKDKICLKKKTTGIKWINISQVPTPEDSQDILQGYVQRLIPKDLDIVQEWRTRTYTAGIGENSDTSQSGGEFPCEAILFEYVRYLVMMRSPNNYIDIYENLVSK
jgi:hypothetical protein